MARQLFMHDTNPGASMYFGDAGLRDRAGQPVLLGRIALMNDTHAPSAAWMCPCTHLRAVMFVVERTAYASDAASYILDLGAFPEADMARHGHARYWDAHGGIDCGEDVRQRRPPATRVRPTLPEHEHMPSGLPVLKEALRMATHFYPESLKKVYFYRPTFLFKAVFKIFSMWVPQHTRDKFVLVSAGEEYDHFLAPRADCCDPQDVPVELGGSGPPMDGDRFLARAVERYDATAVLPPAA